MISLSFIPTSPSIPEGVRLGFGAGPYCVGIVLSPPVSFQPGNSPLHMPSFAFGASWSCSAQALERLQALTPRSRAWAQTFPGFLYRLARLPHTARRRRGHSPRGSAVNDHGPRPYGEY